MGDSILSFCAANKYYGWIDVVRFFSVLRAQHTICINNKIKQLKNIEFSCYYLYVNAHSHLLSSLTEDINQVNMKNEANTKKTKNYVPKTVIDFKKYQVHIMLRQRRRRRHIILICFFSHSHIFFLLAR